MSEIKKFFVETTGLHFLAKTFAKVSSWSLFIMILTSIESNPFHFAFEEAIKVGKFLAHLIGT